MDGKNVKNEAIRKRELNDNYDIPLPEFSSHTNTKWPRSRAHWHFRFSQSAPFVSRAKAAPAQSEKRLGGRK